MRYDTKITFLIKGNETYDPITGKWTIDQPTKKETVANVMDLGTNRSVTLFGHIKQGAKVVLTQPLFVLPAFDQILIDEKVYEVTTTREPLNRNTLIVQEVHNGSESENNGA